MIIHSEAFLNKSLDLVLNECIIISRFFTEHRQDHVGFVIPKSVAFIIESDKDKEIAKKVVDFDDKRWIRALE